MPYTGPHQADPGPGEASIIIYNYIPALALGIVGTVAFVLAIAAHTARFFQFKRTRIFEVLFVLGSIMEVIGYAFRIKSHYSPFLINGFVIQYFMIVCAPVTYSAALYLAFARALQIHPSQDLIPLKPRSVVKIFVAIDILTTILQIVGAALVGSSESAKDRGKTSFIQPNQANDILLAGLCVQTASFLIYFSLLPLAIYRSRAVRAPSQTGFPKLFSAILFITSLLIFLRTVFRVAETAQGVFGAAFSNETLFGCLEFLPVILAVWIWAVFPFGELLPAERSLTEKQAESRDSGSV